MHRLAFTLAALLSAAGAPELGAEPWRAAASPTPGDQAAPPPGLWRLLAEGDPPPIDGLEPPPPAKVPRIENDDRLLQDDLERKRAQRHRRDKDDRGPPASYGKKREANLRKDAFTPRERGFLLEISLLVPGVTTSTDRSSYTVDPTSHINAIWRHEPKRHDGTAGLWYGVRVAPFAGTGFYKKTPGAYGLTYFGPMLGVGKIDPMPVEEGRQGSMASGEVEIPSLDGWLVTGGIAAVTRSSAGEAAISNNDQNSDFAAKGVAFDAPGLWLEARWLHILWGAVGVDAIAGVQTGAGKVFYYVGAGAGAWN